MRKPRNRQLVRTTIAEPFPVFYSHINQKHRKCGEAEGPFYSAGAEFFRPHTERDLEAARFSAAHLGRDGYTVTVDVVTR